MIFFPAEYTRILYEILHWKDFYLDPLVAKVSWKKAEKDSLKNKSEIDFIYV
jgi:hypothetical protein